MTASTGRMACTQDGKSTGASASPPSAFTPISCGGFSIASGSARESQSGMSTEKSESTSWLDRIEESVAGVKGSTNVGSGFERGGCSSSDFDSGTKFFQENGSSGPLGIL